MDAIPDHVRWVVAMPFYAAAYGVAILVFRRVARRRGLDTDGMRLVMGAGLVGGLAGANLAQFLAAGAPGKTIEGGIAGGFLAVMWMKRRLGIIRPTGDLFALAIPAGEAIGRIGCFVGGCCYGKITTAALAVHEHGALRHPAQLYASAAAAASFAILVALERKGILPENGLLYVQIALFALTRFGIEFLIRGLQAVLAARGASRSHRVRSVTCENCGRDGVPEGAHCSSCGHQNRPPGTQSRPISRTSEYVSGSIVGGLLGGPAFLILGLVGSLVSSILVDFRRPWLKPGAIWIGETLLVLVATSYLFSPRGRRLRPFIWSMFVATAVVALGGLAVCAIGVTGWNTK